MHEAVERTGGNLAAAARLLGLTRAQLAYRLRVVEQRKAD
jgi:two-component system response regulator HydG